MKTYATKASDINRKWYLLDATDKTLGRLATEVASILKGKSKTNYVPYLDMGDYVVVVNAEKIKVSGNKFNQKIYYRHSGYIGGLSEISFARMMDKDPTFIIKHAVRGMLPHNSLGDSMAKKLKVYKGEKHPHKNHKIEVI
ncbi:MAG: 50S ribosomal protein L13 [Actinobacteria bacterium]|nr:50S ribosomal protein L13 [Actinomycetota bacterium]